MPSVIDEANFALNRYPTSLSNTVAGRPQNGRFSAKNLGKANSLAVRSGQNYAATALNYSDNGRGPNSRGATPPNSTVDLGVVKNDYAQGGDGTVARAPGPDRYNTNIAGGLSRDELIRRMEMASTTMRGSPSARAAVLGVYADQVKALDQGELEKNKGNIDASQLQYKGEMDANMQEARGRQDFGNNMGILNRKAELDAAAAKAAMDPEKRALDLAKIRSDIAVNEANALNKSAETSALLPGKREKLWMDKVAALEKAGVLPDVARNTVLDEMGAAGELDNSTSMGAAELSRRSQFAAETVNKGNHWWDQLLSGEDVHVLSDPKIDPLNANINNFSVSSDVGGLAAAQNFLFGDGIKRVTATGADGKTASRLLKGEELLRYEKIIADRERAKAKREMVK